jgi:hypothetical protein
VAEKPPTTTPVLPPPTPPSSPPTPPTPPPTTPPAILPFPIEETISGLCISGKYPKICNRFRPNPYAYLISLSETYSGGKQRSPFKDGKRVKDDLQRYIRDILPKYQGVNYEGGRAKLESVLRKISTEYPTRRTTGKTDLNAFTLEFMGIAMKYCIAMILETKVPIIGISANGGWLRTKISELLDLGMGGDSLPPTSRKTLKRKRNTK